MCADWLGIADKERNQDKCMERVCVALELNEALKHRAFETAHVWQNRSAEVFCDILTSAAGIMQSHGSEAALIRQLQSALASISAADRKLLHLQRTYDGAQKLQELEHQLRDATIEATESMSRTLLQAVQH